MNENVSIMNPEPNEDHLDFMFNLMEEGVFDIDDSETDEKIYEDEWDNIHGDLTFFR